MKSIKSYFEEAIKSNASDLHLIGGEMPMLRIQGELQEMDTKSLPAKELETAINGVLSSEQKKKFQENLEMDFGYEVSGVRFRVNLHRQDGGIGLAARVIPKDIPSPDVLRFEPALINFTNLLDGLVLVVGPTGHGKSTTLASMVEEINKTRKAHIVTVEDPIEFVFEDKKSLIEQREIGTDTHSFAAALKHVLRQDPNVILVGEMRDPETIATVLTAAETGHLVFSTLHTSTAAEAVERIVDVFDGSRQKQVLIQLGAVLRGIVAQQLLPTVDGKQTVAREVLVNTSAVSNLIRENNIAQIYSAMQTGARDGMVTMENSVKQLLKEGLISKETAEKRVGKQRRV
ncbi:MAG TPA: type IV pili twitching motility protein PilT [Candidatus Magasanikbacteria bacterium]|nr:type IV pili twitching motility protein PilT [Candidatus Magasanikbacteria bacterium]